MFKSWLFLLADRFQVSHSKFLGLNFPFRTGDRNLYLADMLRVLKVISNAKNQVYVLHSANAPFMPGIPAPVILIFCPMNKMETISVPFTELVNFEMLISLHV